MSYSLNLLEARLAFSEGRLTERDYMLSCVARARQCEPWLKAFVTLIPPDDLEIGQHGPLAGIPIGVKDIIATKGILTTNGSAAFTTDVPTRDAAIVERIKELGGTVFGKTVTTEFAWRHPGPTVNPWNMGHTPGGSSSGSAAAVAAGIVPLALGTQTVGSVIRPAAYCGVVGFKPSYGIVPREGTYPLAGSLDHIGFFTRSVDDMAYAFAALADDVERPAVDLHLGLTTESSPLFAIIEPPFAERASQEQWDFFRNCVTQLKTAGARVETLTLPARYWTSLEAIQTILAAEAAVIHHDLIAQKPDKVSGRLKALASEGEKIHAVDYIASLQLQMELRTDFTTQLAGFDAALTIPATGDAPEGLAETGDASFCAPWTFLGVPAINIPAGLSRRGLPLGIQVVGPYLEDARALRAAKWVEQALPRPAGQIEVERTAKVPA